MPRLKPPWPPPRRSRPRRKPWPDCGTIWPPPAAADAARIAAQTARSDRDAEARDRQGREQRLGGLTRARDGWIARSKDSGARIAALEKDAEKTAALLKQAEVAPQGFAEQRGKLLDTLTAAEQRKQASSDAMAVAESAAAEAAARPPPTPPPPRRAKPAPVWPLEPRLRPRS